MDEKRTGVPVATPSPVSGTLSRMTVVFRPAHLDPAALDEAEVFDNGEQIPDALIHTEQLPKGFPTELPPSGNPGGLLSRRFQLCVGGR